MSPSPKSMDNREELSVVNVVIPLGLIEGVGYTSDRLESTSAVLLGENSPRSELRRVYFEEERVFVIWSL
jgi:hypothetical protein